MLDAYRHTSRRLSTFLVSNFEAMLSRLARSLHLSLAGVSPLFT